MRFMLRKTSKDFQDYKADDNQINLLKNEHIKSCKVDAWIHIFCQAAQDKLNLLNAKLWCKFIREVLNQGLPWQQFHLYEFSHYHLRQADKLINDQPVILKYGFNWEHRLTSLWNVIREFNTTLQQIEHEKLSGNESYKKENQNMSVHHYQICINLLGSIDVNDLQEVMNNSRMLKQQKMCLIINNNLSQTYIKCNESYQALHQAGVARKMVPLLAKAAGTKEIFDRDFKALAEKATARQDTAHNMIGLFQARYSNRQTEGLKVGSLISHVDNHQPGIFQSSKVLITKFRRTGKDGAHVCEGIIINKPSELNQSQLGYRRPYYDFLMNQEEQDDDDSDDEIEDNAIEEDNDEYLDENDYKYLIQDEQIINTLDDKDEDEFEQPNNDDYADYLGEGVQHEGVADQINTEINDTKKDDNYMGDMKDELIAQNNHEQEELSENKTTQGCSDENIVQKMYDNFTNDSTNSNKIDTTDNKTVDNNLTQIISGSLDSIQNISKNTDDKNINSIPNIECKSFENNNPNNDNLMTDDKLNFQDCLEDINNDMIDSRNNSPQKDLMQTPRGELSSENKVDDHLTYNSVTENLSQNENYSVEQTQLISTDDQIKSNNNQSELPTDKNSNILDVNQINPTSNLEEITCEIPQDPGDTIEDEEEKSQRLKEAYIKLWAKLDRVKRLNNLKKKKKKQLNKKQNEKIIAYIGGPCDMSKKIQLHNVKSVPKCEKVCNGVQIGGDVDFEDLKKDPNNVIREYQGYAAWFEGQLDGEIENNDWLLNNDVKAEDVFKDYELVKQVQ